jgi:arginyl-tRNA synthetase
MSLFEELTELAGAAFAAAGADPALGLVVRSQRPELGQFQANGALAAAKQVSRNPRQLAEEIAATMGSDPRIDSVTVAGPGFLNIRVTDAALAGALAALAGDERLGVPPPAVPHRVIVDYGGPNAAKDLHVGHIRTALIGESLKRVFRFQGHEALGDVHLGDWGAPMGQLIAAVAESRPDLPYFDPGAAGPFPAASPVTIDDLQEMYPVAASRVKDDPVFAAKSQEATVALQQGRPGYRALWEHFRSVSVVALKAVYDQLGVEFELWMGEASVNDRLADLVDRLTGAGVAVRSEGAIIVPVAEEGDTQEIPPLILENSRGGYTYGTSDLATIEVRVDELGAVEIVYIVDLRQSLHLEQVFRAARRAGIAGPEIILDHSGNGTVNGPDGRPFKTRHGDLPRLRDIIAETIDKAMERLDENSLATGYDPAERREIARLVGLAALKYGELSNHRSSNYSFDIDKFTRLSGKTGPYVQYGATRIRSILRNAEQAGVVAGPPRPPVAETERALILELVRLPDVIRRTAEQRAPNHLAEFCFELTGAFNRFYDDCHILSEPDAELRGSWLTLVATTLRSMELLLHLLTIEIPDRM